MTTPLETTGDADDMAPGGPQIFTWFSADGARVEQARIVPSEDRLRVRGHLIEAETQERPAFTLTYDVEVDDSGQLRSVGLESVSASGEPAINMRRDGEGAWLIERATGETERIGEAGVSEVLLEDSMLFFSLAVRANGLHRAPDEISRTALSVNAYDLVVADTPMSFRSDDAMVHGITGEAATSAHVDAEGFVIDVPGSTARR